MAMLEGVTPWVELVLTVTREAKMGKIYAIHLFMEYIQNHELQNLMAMRGQKILVELVLIVQQEEQVCQIFVTPLVMEYKCHI